MTKLNEKMHYDEDNDKIIIEQKHDYTPILNQTAQLRSDGKTDFGESKLVGVIPMGR